MHIQDHHDTIYKTIKPILYPKTAMNYGVLLYALIFNTITEHFYSITAEQYYYIYFILFI